MIDVGVFSMSLAVKNLAKTKAFYEAFGFVEVAGEPDKKWVILANGVAKIGLFQGMFEADLVTFNPPDARIVESKLREAGIEIERPTEGETGPCHFVVRDPDGRVVLIDQHGP